MKPEDPDLRKGAVEGDRPDDPQQFNANAGPVNEDGMPKDGEAICEDAIGANVDHNARHDGVAGAAEDASETAGPEQEGPEP